MSDAGSWTADDVRRTMSANVVRLRVAKGWSQSDLAAKMQEAGHTHWRQTTVSRVENGKQRISADDLELLGEVLGGDLLAGLPVFATGVDLPVFATGVDLGQRGKAALRRAEQLAAESLREARLARALLDMSGFLRDHPEYADRDAAAVFKELSNGEHQEA